MIAQMSRKLPSRRIAAHGAVAVLCFAALTFLDSSAAATSKPNGATILYTDVGTNGLWTMNLDGSNKSQIKPATNCDDPAAYSPDGSHVAYYDCKSARLLVNNADWGHPIEMSKDRPIWVRWAGNSTLVWVSQDVNNPANRATKAATLDDPARVHVLCTGCDDVPSVNPAGSRVALDVEGSIWTFNLDGSGGTQLTQPPPNTADVMPAWSPDGTRISFVYVDLSNGYPPRYSLRVMNADGNNPQELTGCVQCNYPVWSPGSDFLIYQDYDATNGGFALDRVNSNGAGGTMLVGTNGGTFSVNAGFGSLPLFTPDGATVVFDGGYRLGPNAGFSSVYSTSALAPSTPTLLVPEVCACPTAIANSLKP